MTSGICEHESLNQIGNILASQNEVIFILLLLKVETSINHDLFPRQPQTIIKVSIHSSYVSLLIQAKNCCNKKEKGDINDKNQPCLDISSWGGQETIIHTNARLRKHKVEKKIFTMKLPHSFLKSSWKWNYMEAMSFDIILGGTKKKLN